MPRLIYYRNYGRRRGQLKVRARRLVRCATHEQQGADIAHHIAVPRADGRELVVAGAQQRVAEEGFAPSIIRHSSSIEWACASAHAPGFRRSIMERATASHHSDLVCTPGAKSRHSPSSAHTVVGVARRQAAKR